jgi:hypothetical protein
MALYPLKQIITLCTQIILKWKGENHSQSMTDELMMREIRRLSTDDAKKIANTILAQDRNKRGNTEESFADSKIFYLVILQLRKRSPRIDITESNYEKFNNYIAEPVPSENTSNNIPTAELIPRSIVKLINGHLEEPAYEAPAYNVVFCNGFIDHQNTLVAEEYVGPYTVNKYDELIAFFQKKAARLNQVYKSTNVELIARFQYIQMKNFTIKVVFQYRAKKTMESSFHLPYIYEKHFSNILYNSIIYMSKSPEHKTILQYYYQDDPKLKHVLNTIKLKNDPGLHSMLTLMLSFDARYTSCLTGH